MRIVLIIFGVLSSLGVILGSLLTAVKDADLLQVADLGGAGSMALSMMGADSIDNPGGFATSQYLAYFMVLVGIFGLVALFLKNRSIVLAGAGLVAVGSILLWVLTPAIDLGPLGGASPKGLAMIAMISGIICGGCIYGAFTTRKPAAA